MQPLRLPPSRVPDPAGAPALRWGILGPGGIAAEFARTLRRFTRQEVVAVGSRSRERAEAFAAKHDVGHAHGSYEDLVSDPGLDVVYVASPASEHLAHALLAIAAGKHVLVEKPLACSAAEAEALIAAARERGVVAIESMWMRFLPQADVIAQALDSGLLGPVRWVFADHGQCFEPERPARLFDPSLGGGALLDLGAYPVSFATLVLGELTRVAVAGSRGTTGVDLDVAVAVADEAGAHGLLAASLRARTPTSASVCGTAARIELQGSAVAGENGFYGPTELRLLGPDDEELDSFVPARRDDGLAYPAAELARCVAADRLDSAAYPQAEALRAMRTLDRIADLL